MNILILPELFYLATTNLNDKEKIFLIFCSKIAYNFKSLLIFNSEYNLRKIHDKWCVSNIKNIIIESIAVRSKYVKFISNNTNIKLFYNEKIIGKMVLYGYSYLVMKIMLNNNDSIENINNQFIKALGCGYLDIVKLLINLGANTKHNAFINASDKGHIPIVKLLIKNGVNVKVFHNWAIIRASENGPADLRVISTFLSILSRTPICGKIINKKQCKHS